MNIETDTAPKKDQGRRGGQRKVIGILLSVSGIFWLAKQAGWMPIEHSHQAIFWPIVAIAVGLFMLLSSGHRHAA